MPKGGRKRTQEEYEKEIEDAIKRFRKYPERLRASLDSEDWEDFLVGIGIWDEALYAGADFWERVRQGVQREATARGYQPGFSEREIVEANVTAELYQTKSGKEVIRYRDNETGRFVSREDVESGRF